MAEERNPYDSPWAFVAILVCVIAIIVGLLMLPGPSYTWCAHVNG